MQVIVASLTPGNMRSYQLPQNSYASTKSKDNEVGTDDLLPGV